MGKLPFGSHKAYPDEKGTESSSSSSSSSRIARGHKAYPDEKGTERRCIPLCIRLLIDVTRHIPMKRELKGTVSVRCRWRCAACHKAYPDEKGTERKRE